jgi:Arc/MetJ-type ribon-helix-helix transcriptional regulator
MMLRMKERVTISVEPEVIQIAREDVEAGRAANVSAAVEEAVKARARRRALREALAMREEEFGPIPEEERAWAKKEMGRVRAERRKRAATRSSSTPER